RPCDRELRIPLFLRVLAEDQLTTQQRALQLTGHLSRDHPPFATTVNDNLRLRCEFDPPEFSTPDFVVVYELLNSSDQRYSAFTSDTGSILVSQPLHNIRQHNYLANLTHQHQLPLSDSSLRPRPSPVCALNRLKYRAEIRPQTAADAAFRRRRLQLDKWPDRRTMSITTGMGRCWSGSATSPSIICLVLTLLLLACFCYRLASLSGEGPRAAALNSQDSGCLLEHCWMLVRLRNWHPPKLGGWPTEDDYGAYSSAQQLQHQQQMLQLNKLKHATVTRDRLYSSATSAPAKARKSRLCNSSNSQCRIVITKSRAGGGVGGNRAVLSTPQPRRQSHTLPRGGFSVDGKSAGFPLQQTQQQQLHAMQQRAPFSPYTEASFV
uniref:Uncharacterized protein n=1 Tax=Macrostomum lignano TaxID=282301 RepID=A0A1I8F2G4_9PLAT